ncbi:MAG: FtsW/RodA/SpoVE family cell cycle protein [Verrucomicrobiales bacterium]
MFGLIGAGIFAIYSATHFRTDDLEIQGMWRRQIQWGVAGLLVFFVAALIDYRWIRWGAIPAFLAGVAGLVLVQSIGIEVHSNKSWIRIPGVGTVQPSQFAIAAGIIVLSFVFGELHKLHHVFRYHFIRLFIAGIVVVVPLAFVLKEGDLGSAMVWLPVFGAMVLAGSIPFRYLIAGLLCGLIVAPLAFFFVLKPYQQKRVSVSIRLLRGEKVEYQKEGYAPINVVNAIGSAGWEGKGFGGKRMPLDAATGKPKKTVHQLGLIPKDTAHNDYIFAVFAEEQGFRGALLLICGFGLLVFQCVFIAFCARDQMGRLIVVGVAALVFAHVFQNIGMQVHLMPITGIPLPFVSYGGTFLVTLMFLMGLVQSVWTHRNVALQDEAVTKQKDPLAGRRVLA